MNLTRIARLPIVATALLSANLAEAAKDSLVTAVFSSTSNGYTRKFREDGSPKPQYYALARGRYLPGISKDRTIDGIEFPKVAGTIAEFLGRQGYFLAENSKSAELLLLITWGTTVPFGDGTYRAGLDGLVSAVNNAQMAGAAAGGERSPDGIQSPGAAVAGAAQSALESQLLQMQMFEEMRMQANLHNGRLLGYVEEINDRNNPSRFAGAGTAYDELIEDLESERYFVIVQAFDFRAAQKGEVKPLWVTRMSVQRQGNKFDRDFAAMVSQASQFFGRESGRLIRRYREGTVTLGELRVVSIVGEEPDEESEPAPEKK
jgi:hypothetical protein